MKFKEGKIHGNCKQRYIKIQKNQSKTALEMEKKENAQKEAQEALPEKQSKVIINFISTN